MTRFIQWKGAVAHSSTWVLLLLAVHTGFAQPAREPLQKKITLHGDRASAEAVLQRLETLANIHFIYSSSLIELNKPLVVSFYDRPLKEVLNAIGKQLGVEVKIQGNYVVLKKISTPAPVITAAPVASRTARVALRQIPTPSMHKPEPGLYHDSLITYRALKRTLLHYSDPGLDTAFLRQYLRRPVHNVLKPARHRHWQVSVAAFANDYAAGTEVHAGTRTLYAVASTGYLRSGCFRNGIGAGTSLQIKPQLYLNPVYTYGRLRYTEEYNAFNTLKVTAHHHQLKFMLTYALNKHIAFQLGPAFNLLKSHYTFKPEELRAVVVKRATATMGQVPATGPDQSGNGGWGGGHNADGFIYDLYFTQSIQPATRYQADYEALRSWVGFEAGISYSINFYHRP